MCADGSLLAGHQNNCANRLSLHRLAHDDRTAICWDRLCGRYTVTHAWSQLSSGATAGLCSSATRSPVRTGPSVQQLATACVMLRHLDLPQVAPNTLLTRLAISAPNYAEAHIGLSIDSEAVGPCGDSRFKKKNVKICPPCKVSGLGCGLICGECNQPVS